MVIIVAAPAPVIIRGKRRRLHLTPQQLQRIGTFVDRYAPSSQLDQRLDNLGY
jgi:hypothetical protein